MAKRKPRIKLKPRKASARTCRARKTVSAADLVDQVKFLSSANRLKSRAKFTQKEKDDILDQLQRNNASYEMLYKLSEQMNTEKNYEVVITMLKSKGNFNTCDQKLILEMAEAFIRDVGN